MTNDDGIEFLLDFTQYARRADPGEIPVDVLVNDFNERQKLCHG